MFDQFRKAGNPFLRKLGGTVVYVHEGEDFPVQAILDDDVSFTDTNGGGGQAVASTRIVLQVDADDVPDPIAGEYADADRVIYLGRTYRVTSRGGDRPDAFGLWNLELVLEA